MLLFPNSLQTPYIIYVEVLEVEDLYSSSVPAKIMSSLRHTKSEENLGVDSNSLSAFSMCGNICDDTDPEWSQEDDEISQQVLIYLFCHALDVNFKLVVLIVNI